MTAGRAARRVPVASAITPPTVWTFLMNSRTARFAVPALVALALTVTGCAAGSEPTAPSASASTASTFNEADVAFAQGMIPHHEQAVAMCDVLLAKDGTDPQVVALAEAITAAQQPEIDRLHAMLSDWGAAPGEGMEHSGHGSGMMSEADMAELHDASGADAGRLFLEQMIEHHEGAVAMAETEVAEGVAPEAVEMAQQIIDAQRAEIDQMRDLLGDR